MPQAPSPLPASVLRDLATDYSRQIFGTAGHKLNLSTLRVLFPALLGPEAKESLRDAVACSPRMYRSRLSGVTYPFLYHDGLAFQNSQALWIHQPGSCSSTPAGSHAWVEATHCFFYNWGEHVHPGTPMFWFAAPGSGVWINLGRTLVLDKETYGQTAVDRAHKWIVRLRGSERGAALQAGLRVLLGLNHSSSAAVASSPMPPIPPGLADGAPPLETVQFPRRSPASWRGECMDEIITLRFGAEMSFVTSLLLHEPAPIRCGPPDRLQRCTIRDAAMRAHGPSCARRTPPEIAARINCSGRWNVAGAGGDREGLAARSAAALVRAVSQRERITEQQAVDLLRAKGDDRRNEAPGARPWVRPIGP